MNEKDKQEMQKRKEINQLTKKKREQDRRLASRKQKRKTPIVKTPKPRQRSTRIIEQEQLADELVRLSLNLDVDKSVLITLLMAASVLREERVPDWYLLEASLLTSELLFELGLQNKDRAELKLE